MILYELEPRIGAHEPGTCSSTWSRSEL